MPKISRLPLTAPLVLAARAGLKTMSRRVMVPQPVLKDVRADCLRGYQRCHECETLGCCDNMWGNGSASTAWPCKYGKPGDILALTESFRFVEPPAGSLTWYEQVDVEYLADKAIRRVFMSPDFGIKVQEWKQPYKGKPPMYMGLDLCRTFVPLAEVRAERVQDITGEDVLAEGIGQPWNGRGIEDAGGMTPEFEEQLRQRFSNVWDSINGARADGAYTWARNPWVWVLRWDPEITEQPPC